MVHVCEQAIGDSGVSCDLIDLQTLVPWDKEAIVSSVEKTGRCVIVHEAPKTSGFGAEMAASIQERCFYHLKAPLKGLQDGTHHSPILLNGITCPDHLESRQRSRKHRRSEMSNFVFKLPDIGEGVVEGEVVQWHVSVGDSVSEDDPIVDVMTDKATVTIPSPTSGVIKNSPKRRCWRHDCSWYDSTRNQHW